MKEGKKYVDIKTELLRTIACFMVILIHIRLSPVVGGSVIKTPVLIGCILTPSVGIFFLITGFFLYNGNKSIGKILKHFLIKILLPALFVVFLTIVFNGWLLSESSAAECIRNTDYLAAFKALINGICYVSSDYWGVACAHLWYIAEYAKVILFFPAAVILVRYAGLKVLLYLAGMNVLFCFLIDLYRLFGQFTFFYMEPFLRASQALVFIGCLMYYYRDRIKKVKRLCPVLLGAYIASVLWMFYAQTTQFRLDGGDWSGAYFTTWLSGIGMISAILLTAFILYLPDKWKIWSLIEGPVKFLGGLSFPVYLIQYAVIIKFGTSKISEPFKAFASSPVKVVLYYLLFGSLVFLVSVVIVLLARLVFRAFSAFFHQIANVFA